MKKEHVKRQNNVLLALVLSCAIFAGIFTTGIITNATPARAADELCEIVETGAQYTTFASALAAVEDNQTIKLLTNMNSTTGIVVTDKTITIYLNGFILDVKNSSGHGLEVGSGGVVLLDNSAGGKFNVKGGGSGNKHGVYAHDGGKAEVTNASSSMSSGDKARGAYATGANSTITVYENLPFATFYGLEALNGATVTVYGNVEGGGGMIVSGKGTYVEVFGYVSGGGTGVIAYDGAEVYVHGNVIGGGAGVQINNGSKVTVDGYIRADDGEHIYVKFSSPVLVNKMQTDFESTSSKAGYFEYNDGVSYVWVKKFNPALPTFTITYLGNDNTEGSTPVDSNVYTFGSIVTVLGNIDLVKNGYTFKGWDADPLAIHPLYSAGSTFTINSDVILYAIWEENAVIYFTITFLDHDGKVIDTQLVEQGKDASAPPNPSKSGSIFIGWNIPFVNVQEDLTVIALYEPVAIYYNIVFRDIDGSILKVENVIKGGNATAPLAPYLAGYIFTGWDKPFSDIQSHLDIYAQYAPVDKVIITFIDWDGTSISIQEIERGNDAVAPANPAREGYTFSGWDKPYTNIQENLTVTAQYTKDQVIKETFTVTFFDHDGTILKTEVVEKGQNATAPENRNREEYTFNGWDKPYTNIQGDLVVNALYTKNPIEQIEPKLETQDYSWVWWIAGGVFFFFTLLFFSLRRTYKVTFFNEKGEKIKSIKVGKGKRTMISSLPSPYDTLEIWWYKEKNIVKRWDINEGMAKKDLRLHAGPILLT